MEDNNFKSNDNAIPHQVRNDEMAEFGHCGLEPQSQSLDSTDKLYYVGGVVRDKLLGIESLDTDLVYEGNAIEFAGNLEIPPAPLYKGGKIKTSLVKADYELRANRRGAGGAGADPLNASNQAGGGANAPEGFEILQINEPFGTVRVKIGGHEFDIASTREEIYERKGHLPTVTKIGCPLKDDVKRRDFTINSLYKSVTTGEIVDLTGGLEDLKNKTIRVLHDESFIDDPTRIIRALKFSVRFGFKLDKHTKKLQEDYLKNINYDMCYKRIKKELIETFNLNSQAAFETFIKDGIYKLVTEKKVSLPRVNIEKLINKFSRHCGLDPQSQSCHNDITIRNIWLIYAGVLGDLSRLPLTKTEQKILDDYNSIGKLKNDFEIYRAFEKVPPETVILYAILKDEKAAMRYFDKLRGIKISINGKDLQEIGIAPSPKYQEIFDYVLKEKLKNPDLSKNDEIKIARDYFFSVKK